MTLEPNHLGAKNTYERVTTYNAAKFPTLIEAFADAAFTASLKIGEWAYTYDGTNKMLTETEKEMAGASTIRTITRAWTYNVDGTVATFTETVTP
jgi:hypothetical protein